MNPKPEKSQVVQIITVTLSAAVGLLLADAAPRLMGAGNKPIAWGREVMGSLAGGLVIACIYTLGREVWTDVRKRKSK